MCSKAEMSQLNLPHVTNKLKIGKKKKKLKSKTDMLKSIGKQSGESVESVLGKTRKATVRRICRKERF